MRKGRGTRFPRACASHSTPCCVQGREGINTEDGKHPRKMRTNISEMVEKRKKEGEEGGYAVMNVLQRLDLLLVG